MTILDKKSREIGERIKIDPFSLLSFFMMLLPVIQSFLEMFFGKTVVKGKDVVRYFMAYDVNIFRRRKERKKRADLLRTLVKRKQILIGMDFQDVEDETVNLVLTSTSEEMEEMIVDAERRNKGLTSPGVKS